jgi:hypothetical protein
LGIRACLAGQRVAFRTATEWVALLADAQQGGRLDDELTRLQRIPLLICDEVGYIPFDPHAANLMFMLVSRRYERASLIVTSNKPFSAWGEIFGDEVTATAMIDRLVDHAEILSLKGDSYRLKDRDLARPPPEPPKRPDRSPTAASRRAADGDYAPRPERQHATDPLPARPHALGAAPARPTGFASTPPTAHPHRGSVFDRRQGVNFRPALTPGGRPGSPGTSTFVPSVALRSCDELG